MPLSCVAGIKVHAMVCMLETCKCASVCARARLLTQDAYVNN